MEGYSGYGVEGIFGKLVGFLRKCAFHFLFVVPVPSHIAFIVHAKKQKLIHGAGHRIGFLALMTMLKYCCELGVRSVTIYAISIDNFKPRPEKVQHLMDLMQEKIESFIKEESVVHLFHIRVYFVGDLKLLNESVWLAAERTMAATANNSRAVLSICVAYTSTNEIVHAVQESSEEKWDEISILDASGAGYGLVGLRGDGNSEKMIHST